jgi:sec-independent protein translocase protein TatC
MNELQKLFALIDELRHRVLRILYVIVPLFAFFIGFEIRVGRVGFLPFPVAYPWPSPFLNVAAQVINWMEGYMLPANVHLINLGIGDAVIAEMEVGLFLAIVVGMPWIVHEVGAFLLPALRHNERALLRTIGIPASLLFGVGFLIGLFWITPFTYLLLFKYVGALQLIPDLSVDSFLEFTILYSLAFGIVCELPVFVFALTKIGLVPAPFWRKHWRGAVMGCLIFGMVITPDNSGITMLLIAIPMVGLYFAGMLAAERSARRKESAQSSSPPPTAAA